MKKFSITVLCLLNCLLITSCTESREQRSVLYGNTAEALIGEDASSDITEEKTSDEDLPKEEEESLDSSGCTEEEKTVEAFLLFDWTEHDVLFGHTIQPGDSAACWEFRIANKTFSRDIVALSAEEQKQELEELYEAIREWAGKQ